MYVTVFVINCKNTTAMKGAFVRFKKVKLISTGVYKRIYLYKDKNTAGKNGQTGFLISGRKKMGWTTRFTTILNTNHKIIKKKRKKEKKENSQLTPESVKLIFSKTGSMLKYYNINT